MKYNLKILLGAFALSLALTACQPTAQYLNGNITASNLRTDI